MFNHIFAKFGPIVTISARFDIPQVELEFTLRKRRALESWVCSFFFGNLHWSFHSCVVDSLKDHGVHLHCLGAFERNLHNLKGISESLNTNSNGSVSHVRILGFDDGVIVPVNYTVEIFSHSLCNLMKFLPVVLLGISVGKFRQRDGS